MTRSDELLIEYARAMTRIQAAPARDASNSELSLGLRVALEALEGAAAIGQTGPESLKAGVAGKLEEEFERSSRLKWRGKERGLPFPRRAALEAATLFADRIWPEVFRERAPASKARRISLAIYQTAFVGKEKPSARFDLNALVFGDNANHGSKVLPVKAAAQYSDAVSVQLYGYCVDSTFHNRASEDGSLFDAEGKKNSTNIFERHFLKPTTLLLQTISFNGKTAPPEALQHLLLSLGLAGSYGGAASIYGVNMRNHPLGIFAGRFERDLSSPYVAIDKLYALKEADHLDLDDPAAVAQALGELYRPAWPVEIPGAAILAAQKDLIARLEADEAALRASYKTTAGKVGAYFDAWFDGVS